MNQEEPMGLPAGLEGGRRLLEQAPQEYGRALTALEYWWLGVGLAAITLAELSEKPYAVGRLEQLIDRLGYKGVKDDWLQRFVEELAGLDAEGLLWPLYERSPEGPMEPTGAEVFPGFGAQEGYFLALAHIAVALAVHREDAESVAGLAGAIGAMLASGVTPEQERLILDAIRPAADEDEEAAPGG